MVLRLRLHRTEGATLAFGQEVIGAEFFEQGGDFAKMNAHVPAKLRASLYESLGKLEPIKSKLKIDEREAVVLPSGWDDSVQSKDKVGIKLLERAEVHKSKNSQHSCGH